MPSPKRKYGQYVVLIAVLLLAIFIPFFIKDPYYLHTAIMVLLNCLLAVSLFPLLRSGLFSVAHAAFMAVGAYCSALLVMKAGMNFWIAMPLSGICASLVAVAIGTTVLRTKGMVFMLITFSLNEAIRLIINSWKMVTGGPVGISEIPRPNPFHIGSALTIKFTSRTANYYLVLALMLITILVIYSLWNSRLGRSWRGIEEADDLAQSIGIDILKYKIMIFGVSCFFAGLAGSFYAHYYRFLSPVDFGIWQSIYPLVYLQVGGVGSIAGPIIGGIVLTVLPEAFRFLTLFQPMVFGTFILITMLFFPTGLIGIPKTVFSRIIQKKWFRSGKE